MKFQKICIIGDGLAGLASTAIFAKKNIQVDIFLANYKKNIFDHRTTAISDSNFNYIKKALGVKNLNYFWPSKKIDLFHEHKNKFISFLKFENYTKVLMHIFQNYKFKKTLMQIIKKNKKVKIINQQINKINHENCSVDIKKKKIFYDLIILCTGNNSNLYQKIDKMRSIKKNYKEIAITALVKNNLKIKNSSQYFLKDGPFAILPVKKNLFSIVWSVNEKFFKKNESNLKTIIKNKIYELLNKQKISINNIKSFPIHLNLKTKYYKKNTLILGEGLHSVHPLAGQGFNLVIRDIKKMDELLTRKIKLGLPIKESNILEEFYQARSPENNILGLGIDMTNIFFKESKYLNPLKNLVLKNINNFPFVRKLSQQISDKGIYF